MASWKVNVESRYHLQMQLHMIQGLSIHTMRKEENKLLIVSLKSVVRECFKKIIAIALVDNCAFRLPAFPITETLESCSRGWFFEMDHLLL